MITITNEDNMQLMSRYPDNHFELAIVDPPYAWNGKSDGKNIDMRKKYSSKDWNSIAPTTEYFNELIRVSQNQIVWGGNYFDLPPTRGFIFWFKHQTVENYADGEFAWTSFDRNAKMFSYIWNGMLQQNMKNKEVRIHPTQKPVKLYEWLLMTYAKEGDKILDTHLGSGSIAIACHNLGFDLTACELDTEYYNAALKRLKQHQAQLTMF